MPASYPTSIPNLVNPSGTEQMNGANLHSLQHGNANDEIEAIANELGTEPSGTDATVKARLDRIESRVPTAWFRSSAAQSIPGNTWTRVALDTQIHLDSAVFSFDDVNDRISVSKSGLYLVIARMVFEQGSGGQRYMRTRVMGGSAGGGTSYLGRVNDSYSADSNEISDTHYIDLQSGQSVGFDAYSTGATTTRASNSGDEYMFSQLQIVRLGTW